MPTAMTSTAGRAPAAPHPLAGPARRLPGDRVRGACRPGTMSPVPIPGPGAVLTITTAVGGPGREDTVMHLATRADDVGSRGPVRTSVTGAVGARGPARSASSVHPVAARVPGLLGERLP